MTDEELEELIDSGNYVFASISEEKLIGDIKNVIEFDLENLAYDKKYKKVAKEIASRLFHKGISEGKEISFEKLSPVEQKAVEMVRNDSTLDNEHLKGDFVISNFFEVERIRQNQSPPPRKRLQLNDEQLSQLFQLKFQKESVREIARQMNLNRGTINKVLQKDYVDTRDRQRIAEAEQKARSNHKS
ncbi:hypothetical protein P7E02_03670 [Enterococcus hulanensis]|uniref:hypothetical protein n=1 Tax=Enterococcus hulanensis TaxID=2559929 RepID=UPI0028906D1F|nr:hypothetical protein [Enterococcus hulanensis]MDT2658950.1 hypothetical protein [Enterococcus hulanensis]